MLSIFEKKRIENNLVSIKVYFAINDVGDFIMFPCGKGNDIKYYIENNINKVTLENFSSYLLTLMEMSSNKVSINNDSEDKFHLFEMKEYKKNRCKTMKLISISIHKMYPSKIVITDLVNTAKYAWGGGRYMHFLPINAHVEEIFSLIKNIYEYNGHMSGASEAEKNKYRVLN